MSTLWLKDTDADTDGVSGPSEAYWASPAIRVFPTVTPGTTPIYDLYDTIPYHVDVVVQNRDPGTVVGSVTCELYLGRSGFREDPAGSTDLLGSKTGLTISGPESSIPFDWTPNLGLGHGAQFHGCLLARVKADGEDFPAPWTRPEALDRVAQHNINIQWTDRPSPAAAPQGFSLVAVNADDKPLRQQITVDLIGQNALTARVLRGLHTQYPGRNFNLSKRPPFERVGLALGEDREPLPRRHGPIGIDGPVRPRVFNPIALRELRPELFHDARKVITLEQPPHELRRVDLFIPQGRLERDEVFGLRLLNRDESGRVRSGVAVFVVGGAP